MNFNHCKIRKIKGIEATTPILVPSFSSKGFEEVEQIYNRYRGDLTDAILISAYDLYYENIHLQDIYETELLIVDSGGYERDKEHDLSTVYNEKYTAKPWTRDLYIEQLNQIENLTPTIIVNYDIKNSLSLEQQVKQAQEDFENHKSFASDFLFKPSRDNLFFNIEEYCENIEYVKDFSILGFTEKEIGQSLLERCNNIYKIRRKLEEKELEIPIHIFGCIDPSSIIAYFLCGADVFDGLSWLRFAFNDSVPIYFNSYALVNGLWDYNNEDMKALAILDNIKALERLNIKLQEFTISKDLSNLCLKENTLSQIQELLEKVLEGD